MGSTKSYDFIPLGDENIHLLIPLYRQVFGVNYTLQQIKIKYQDAYTGIHAQGYYAFYNGKAVAFHGAIPMFMNYRNEKELCAQYGDAMTLKSHAGNGLFTKLGELTDDRLKQMKVRFVWGFPNQNSEYGYVNKLHWRGEERMQCYILQLKTVSSETVYRKTKVFEKYNQQKIKKLLAPIVVPKENLHSIDPSISGGIDRSTAFYNYKSFSYNYFIQLKHAKVWIKPVGGLLVGDIEIINENQFYSSIEELKLLGNKLGLNKVVLQCSPKSLMNQLLMKKYLPIDSWLIGYKNFNSNLPLERLQFTYGDLDTF